MRVEAARFPMSSLRLYHSRAKCVRRLLKMGITTQPLDTDAQMWLVGDQAVILIECELDWHAEAAMLVHEAVHVADEWLRALGEGSPGDEERACLVQCISEPLFRAHEAWKREHGRCA